MLSPGGRVAVTFGVVGALILFALVQNAAIPPRSTGGKLLVAATFYPYEYMASRVGGDEVQVFSLLPSGVEPHDWEPTPSAIARMMESDVLVYNGYLERYSGSLFSELPLDRPIRVNTSVGVQVARTENGEVDPHVWLDPLRAIQIVDAIESAFVTVRPAAASLFRANAEQLRAELSLIDTAYEMGLRSCALHTIVTQHESFGYVSARYNLTMVAIQGLSPDAEPTPQVLAAVRDAIRRTGVRYIFYEELADPRVAQTLAAEAGVGTLVLDPIEGLSADAVQRGEDFLTILCQQNLANLRVALQCT